MSDIIRLPLDDDITVPERHREVDLKAPRDSRAYADTLREVVAKLERHEKMAAAKAKVAEAA
jgi:hypothetical protein